MWFNENAGIMTLILLIVSVIAFVFIIILTLSLRNRIAVQKLKMVGFYSRDTASRENYAEFTVGNRSLNDVGVSEIGLRNGKINLDFTALYMKKANINPGTRIVIDQRSSITFRLTEEELSSVLLESRNGKKLYRLRLYVVDIPGNVYYGNMHAVRKLLAEYLHRLDVGDRALPPAVPVSPKLPAAASQAAPEEPSVPAKEPQETE